MPKTEMKCECSKALGYPKGTHYAGCELNGWSLEVSTVREYLETVATTALGDVSFHERALQLVTEKAKLRAALVMALESIQNRSTRKLVEIVLEEIK